MSGGVAAAEAEKATIGACSVSPDAIDEVSAILSPDHFATPQNGMVFRAILALHEKGKPVDSVTVAKELQRQKTIGEVGLPYLAEVLESMPFAEHARFYANIVHEAWQRREITYAAMDAAAAAKDEGRTPDEIAANTEARIHRVIESGIGRQGQTVDQVMTDLFNALANPKPRGIPSGYSDLDEKLGGLRPGTLTILAARPSIGKSALAGGVAINVAQHGVPVLFFSFEQAAIELAERWLAADSSVHLHKIRKGGIDEVEMHSLTTASSRLAALPLRVDDTPGRTLQQISNLSRLEVRRRGAGLVIVDYLQLIEPEDHRTPREQQVSRMSRGLKCLARSLNVPVICLAQLNRMSEARTNKRPALADLRESGAIEQDADTVMLLHRPSFYAELGEQESVSKDGKKNAKPFGSDDPNYAEVIVAKNRGGETGTVQLTWRGEFTQFRNFEGMNTAYQSETTYTWDDK